MFSRLFGKKTSAKVEEIPPEPKKKQALIVIAPQNFRDEEYFETREELEKKDIEVTVASLTRSEKKGSKGGIVFAQKAIGEVKVDEYDAVVFVGGSGAQIYFKNPIALDLPRQFYDKGKIVAAICIAPTILANSGILSGRKATIFKDTGVLKLFEDKDVEYSEKPVEVDGRIITANGPAASREFGKKIAEILAKS